MFSDIYYSSFNLQPELSALLGALEQSVCNPETTSVLVRCLVRILEVSPEKTVASFKTLGVVSRVLKVACVQAQESKRTGNLNSPGKNSDMEVVSVQDQQKCNSHETVRSWFNSMELCMELYAKFSSAAEDARSLILNSSSCIDNLFDLFWVEGLRNDVLREILELMKVFLNVFSVL